MADEQEGEDAAPEIVFMDASQMGGVWANFAAVSHSEHEFTIDFIRLESSAPPPGRGVVVARVSVSPLFITQLVRALNENWQQYAKKALPKEVYGPDEPSNPHDP